MDHSKHTPLTRQDLNQAVLADAPVYGADDRKIGTETGREWGREMHLDPAHVARAEALLAKVLA